MAKVIGHHQTGVRFTERTIRTLRPAVAPLPVREISAPVFVEPAVSGTAAISIVVASMSDDAAAAGSTSSRSQTSASASDGSVASASRFGG